MKALEALVGLGLMGLFIFWILKLGKRENQELAVLESLPQA